jgi:hypothetical protein
MIMKSSIFLDKSPRRQELTDVSEEHVTRKQAASIPACWFLAWLIPRPCRWRRHVRLKRVLISNGLYGVISQEIELFKHYFVGAFNITLQRSGWDSSKLPHLHSRCIRSKPPQWADNIKVLNIFSVPSRDCWNIDLQCSTYSPSCVLNRFRLTLLMS